MGRFYQYLDQPRKSITGWKYILQYCNHRSTENCACQEPDELRPRVDERLKSINVYNADFCVMISLFIDFDVRELISSIA